MPCYSHEYWMAKALQLARNGLYSVDPNPSVGCVIVKDNVCVSEGWHEFRGGPHAEINAINNQVMPKGCQIYVSLEPCSHLGKTPPCVDVLISLNPASVVIATQDPNPLVAGKGIAKLETAGIEVTCGVLEKEARHLNRGFMSRMERNRPFLRVKMASSLDGRTALSNGVSQWISGEPARLDVQRLRARSSAILTSARTVIADDPAMNVRLSNAALGQTIEVRQPIRVIVDSKLSLTGTERIFSTGGQIRIITANTNPIEQARLTQAGAEVIVLDNTPQNGKIDLTQMMQYLASIEINEVHTECGQHLAGALIQQRLVDEIVLYMAPCFLGNKAQGLFDLGDITQMKDRLDFQVSDMRNLGEDIRLTLTPEYQ
ncbi:MAG: diaminohydroxyphosphoribosylaminopyrimidine deaminase [Gammaproteobacteria bacterium]|jgi:diaminohydroxyphosphoribosylaminopyrimidine deaminase/5-amino-6-(5-phosphoribosylamino)uracil reductase